MYPDFSNMFSSRPKAVAMIKGSTKYPSIQGEVWMYENDYGVIVVADIMGLPLGEGEKDPIFAMHIHSGGECTGDSADPFANVGMHYNPTGASHPYHAGDLPPLFGTNGYAFAVTLTDRFHIDDVIGRSIIIHSNPDDFTTQPSGNSGAKIACGKILAVR